jgi:hypothetical protein
MPCEYCCQRDETGEFMQPCCEFDGQCESAVSEIGTPLCGCCRREMLLEEEEVSVGGKTCL